MISFIIPIYNEEDILEKNINHLIKFLKNNNVKYELILSNDGSKDKSLKIMNNLSKKNRKIKSISNKNNKGRGYALKKTCKFIHNSKVIFMDCDIPLNIDLKIINKLIFNLDKFDIVIASRYMKNSRIKRKLYRQILTKTYLFLVNLFFPNLKVSDTDVGLKAFKQNAFVKINKKVESNGWPWDLEFMLEARKKGYKIGEIPLTWIEKGKTSVNPIRDSLIQFFSLIHFKNKYKHL